ncbi:MAG: transcriptional repressor LexA [Planctomycetota bacterium]|nr:transcriptional repressor LexA [Planctomycetota bacterium]
MARLFTTELTKRQQQVLDWVHAFTHKQGFPPTVREIGAAFHITPRAVFDFLKALERKGCLKRGNLGARSLEFPAAQKHEAGCERCSPVRVVGRIAAGKPVMAAEDDLGAVPVNSEWLHGQDCYALRVKGDSMVDAAILDGDWAIIRKQDTADDGDIVVALIDDEATLKYLHREPRRIRLQPANPRMKPLYIKPEDLQIQGKLIGVHRSYDSRGGRAR